MLQLTSQVGKGLRMGCRDRSGLTTVPDINEEGPGRGKGEELSGGTGQLRGGHRRISSPGKGSPKWAQG